MGFLAPPQEPAPVQVQLAWPIERLKLLAATPSIAKNVQSCVLHSGDLLLVPDKWSHATLTLSESIAVGAQLGGAPREKKAELVGIAAVRNPEHIMRLCIGDSGSWAKTWLKEANDLRKRGKMPEQEFKALVNYFEKNFDSQKVPGWL